MEIGTKLGHYEIIDRLGAGGMGEVYRATDTKLKREVALKLLPEDLATDPERLVRLERDTRGQQWTPGDRIKTRTPLLPRRALLSKLRPGPGSGLVFL